MCVEACGGLDFGLDLCGKWVGMRWFLRWFCQGSEFGKVAGMKMWILFVLSAVSFLLGCVFGFNPHHYVAAAFCFALGIAFFVRAVVAASELETQHHQHGH